MGEWSKEHPSFWLISCSHKQGGCSKGCVSNPIRKTSWCHLQHGRWFCLSNNFGPIRHGRGLYQLEQMPRVRRVWIPDLFLSGHTQGKWVQICDHFVLYKPVTRKSTFKLGLSSANRLILVLFFRRSIVGLTWTLSRHARHRLNSPMLRKIVAWWLVLVTMHHEKQINCLRTN